MCVGCWLFAQNTKAQLALASSTKARRHDILSAPQPDSPSRPGEGFVPHGNQCIRADETVAKETGLTNKVSRLPVSPCPLEHVELPASGGGGTRGAVPRAPLVPQPLQDRQVAVYRGARARGLVPRAPVLPDRFPFFSWGTGYKVTDSLRTIRGV